MFAQLDGSGRLHIAHGAAVARIRGALSGRSVSLAGCREASSDLLGLLLRVSRADALRVGSLLRALETMTRRLGLWLKRERRRPG